MSLVLNYLCIVAVFGENESDGCLYFSRRQLLQKIKLSTYTLSATPGFSSRKLYDEIVRFDRACQCLEASRKV